MRVTHRLVLASFLLTLGAIPARFGASVRDVLDAAIPGAIRWYAFWQGRTSLPSEYRPGTETEARVLHTPGHVHVFLAGVRLRVDIVATEPDLRVTSVGTFPLAEASNDDAVASFMTMQQRADADCPAQSATTPESRNGPKNGLLLRGPRLCQPGEHISTDKTFMLVLPVLTPPDSIRDRTTPNDNALLAAAVHRYIDPLHTTCGLTTAKIPYYSSSDLWVSVFVHSDGPCLRGVATFARALDGQWSLGKFFGDVPKEQLGGVISRIESNTAMTISSRADQR
jgi:hypothetical protein